MLVKTKKTILTVLLAALAVGVLAIIPAGAGMQGTVNRSRISEEELTSIEACRSPSETHLLDAVFFNEERLFFDEKANAFYYSIVEKDKTWDNPALRVQSKDLGVKVAFVNPEISRKAIAQNQPLRMLAWTGKEYREYAVYMTSLPLMNIDTWYDIPRAPVTMTMELFDNSGETGMYYSKSFGTVHIHGQFTSSLPKPPLRIVTKSSVGKMESRDANLLGLRNNNRWVLLANYTDPERIRNVFSTELWYRSSAYRNSFGVENSARYKYLELFLNGEYYGLYALGYMPDEYQLKIDTPAGEKLYKNIESYNFRDQNADLRLYFSVLNAFDGYGTKEQTSGYDEDLRVGIGSEEEFALLKNYLNYLREDHTLQEQMAMMDMDAYIDFYLFQNLSQGYDCAREEYTRNYYLSAKKDHDLFRFLITTWDMDRTWGDIAREFEMDSTHNYVFDLGPFAVYKPEENEEVREMLESRYRQLRENEWSDASVMELLDEYEADIFDSGAYARDTERWPDSTHEGPDHDLTEFKAYVLERLACCDEYYGYKTGS